MISKNRSREIDLSSNELLFRYRAVDEKSISALKSDTLYFSTPAYFNDPFDTLIHTNYLEILRNVDYCLTSNMKSYIKRHKGMMAKEQDDLISAIWQSPSGRENLKEDMFRRVREASTNLSEVLLKNTRIICLSEKYDSMLMWSHYADYHKGFCIVYNKSVDTEADVYASDDSLIKKKPVLMPVEYVETQLDLTEEVSEYVRAYKMPNIMEMYPPFTNLSQEKLRKAITQKSLDWEYEKEWRIIPRHISLEHESNLHHMIAKPAALIIGCKCSEQDKHELIEIANDKKIPVFWMIQNFIEPTFSILPLPIKES